tara:strand:- start:601 stop:1242 length:642 start_codon:yes stop_codon:yes gene_type:complete
MIALTNFSNNQDIIFVLITISFFLIALLRASYWKHASLLFMAVFAQRYANQYLREENAFTERVSFITFLLLSINFSLIILKFINFKSILEVTLLILSVMLFFLLKISVIYLIGKVFIVEDVAKLCIFFSLLFDRALAFFLFPFIVILYFFVFDIIIMILIFIAILCLLLLILKISWMFKIGTNSFGISRFYIFLYLCVLEISPILLLGKVVFY